MVLGGAKGVLSTAFGKAALPSFETPPRCFFERQGNFVTSFYPANITADLNNKVGIFVYPPYDGGYKGQPMLGGADLAALFNGNDDDAKKVMQFVTSVEFGAEWAKAGGWLSPHKTFDPANYPDDITRAVAKFAADADVFRFDGSDVMPKAVGSGTFWTEMVKWENGQTSQQTADNIEASWPKS
jgi:alpha-glucoside transport system substrate-binding protein